MKNRLWNVLQLHRSMLVLVFGMGLPHIVGVRQYFVDTMRNYAMRLLTSPNIMWKYILIKPPNEKKTLRQYMLSCAVLPETPCFPQLSSPTFLRKNPAKQALSIFCNSPQWALHPCCNFLFHFGLTNARKFERSLSLRTVTLWLN